MPGPITGNPFPPLLKGTIGTSVTISIDPGTNPINIAAVTYDGNDCPGFAFTIKAGPASLDIVFASAAGGRVRVLANGQEFDDRAVPPLLAPYTLTGA